MACLVLLMITTALMAVLSPGAVQGQASKCFPEDNSQRQAVTKVSTEPIEKFGFELFQQVNARLAKSFMISSYSVWSALTLAYFGSGGNTKAELEKSLGHTGKTTSFNQWRLLNSMLANSQGTTLKTLNKAYFNKNLVLQPCIYGIITELSKIDFSDGNQAAIIINNDVSNATNGLIKDFLSPAALDEANFVLINAVYFKGVWETQFLKSVTRKMDFFVEPEQSVGQIDIMTMTVNKNYASTPSLGASMLELPYQKSSVSMYILLPDVRISDVATVIRRLNPANFAQAKAALRRTNLSLGLPRFKLSTKVDADLLDALYNMGIQDLFLPGKANLTAFSSTPLNVDKAIHQSTIEVSEEGTVATAVTGLVDTRAGGFINRVIFMCNRPFVFLIHDKAQNLTLFAGTYLNPGDVEELQ